MIVSVVIFGKNQSNRLDECLHSVKEMKKPDGGMEIIYVDMVSKDNSIAIAKSYGAKIIRIKGGRVTPAAAKNLGWKHAKGEFILFLNAGEILHPDFVYDALPEFSVSSIACIYGIKKELNPTRSVYTRAIDQQRDRTLGLIESCDDNGLVRRSSLEDVSGFDANLSGQEQADLCLKIRAKGGLILRQDRPMSLVSTEIDSFADYWSFCFKQGKTLAMVADKSKKDKSFWKGEAGQNLLAGGGIVTLLVSSVLGGFIFLLNGGPVRFALAPLLFILIIFAILIFRNWLFLDGRNYGPVTRVCYAIHTYLSQVPMFYGQLSYWTSFYRR